MIWWVGVGKTVRIRYDKTSQVVTVHDWSCSFCIAGEVAKIKGFGDLFCERASRPG